MANTVGEIYLRLMLAMSSPPAPTIASVNEVDIRLTLATPSPLAPPMADIVSEADSVSEIDLRLDSRLEGRVNRAKLKFTNINTTTSRVSVRNKNESAREGGKQIASKWRVW
jgi:hypothetical protein